MIYFKGNNMKTIILVLLLTAGCATTQEPKCASGFLYQSHYEGKNFGECVPNTQ